VIWPQLAATKNKALNEALTWESTMNRKPAVQVSEVCGIDLDYRPRDYFWAAGLKIPLLSGIAELEEFVIVTSDFYPDLGRYYRALTDAWVAQRGKTAPRQSNADRATVVRDASSLYAVYLALSGIVDGAFDEWDDPE
jgi:hypothetical protein